MTDIETALANQILGPDGKPWEQEQRATFRSPTDWLRDWALGQETTSGERVNEQIALGLSAWFCGIRVISEDVAKLPLILYSRRKGGGKDRATGHPIYSLLHDNPNPDMGAMVFEETLLQHAIGWGGGFAEIIRNGSGTPVELWPLDPSSVTPKRDLDRFFYRVTMRTGGFVDLPAKDVLHIHGLGPMGDSGYNVTRIAREALGVHIALQKFAGSFFSAGSTAGAVLEHPNKLEGTALDHLRQSFKERHGGAENAHKPLILEEGMKYQQLGIAPEKGQMNLSRVFSVQDVCRWLRITPSKLFELSHATFSNVEQQSISHVGDTLMPWMVRIEQEVNRKLLPADRKHFAEHLVDGALRADVQTRNNAYKTAIEGGWMSRNEVRIRENMNPQPGLDEFLMPTVGGTSPVGGEPPPGSEPDPADADADDEDRSVSDVARLLADVHRPVLVERFRSVLKRENAAMKRPEQSRLDWLSGHEPYIRQSLIPAVDTFCSSVWCMVNGAEMPDPVLRAVADATAAMSARHVERVSTRALPGAEWEPWPPKAAEAWAEVEMDGLVTTMTAICREYSNDN